MLSILSHQSVIQTILIQQEIINPHNQHSIVIVIRRRCVFRNDDFLKESAGQHQGPLLLFHLCLVGNRIGRLNIITPTSFPLRIVICRHYSYKESGLPDSRAGALPPQQPYFLSAEALAHLANEMSLVNKPTSCCASPEGFYFIG